MTQKDLTYIKTIVDEGGISQAAKKLYLSQPSLSQSVKRIEDSLGVPIFNRTPKCLSLTPEGGEYYLMATKILSIYAAFEENIKNRQELKTGTVLVGATPHRGPRLLPEFLAKFHLKYPGINVVVHEESADELEKLLLQGKIDFALMRTRKVHDSSRSLAYKGLLNDSFMILLPKGHPAGKHAVITDSSTHPVLDPKWLADENFLLPETTMRLRDMVLDILKKAGIDDPRSDYSSIYPETLALLAAAGKGVAIIPPRYYDSVNPNPAPDWYSIPEHYGIFWDISLVTLKDGVLPRASAVFLQEFEEYLGVL